MTSRAAEALAPERSLPGLGSPVSETARLRVLTLNLHKGFSALNRRFVLHEIREAVRAVGADLVFLQEVLGASSHSRDPAVVGLPQYEFLADSLWPQHAYGRNAVSPSGHHGNAVLSKHPIMSFLNIDVSHTGHEARGLLHCVIDVPGAVRPLHAVCVHLGLREQHRSDQIAQLRRRVEEHVPPDAPLLIAGDFNDWRLRVHHALRATETTWADTHASGARGNPARTFPARHPVLRLDRIYVRGTRQHRPIALPRRPWSHLSDHTPLAAEVVL